MRRLIMVLAVVSLVFAACGGDDSGSDAEPDQPEGTQQEQADNGGDSDDPSTDDSGDGEGPSTATVTIGSETYEFSSESAIVAQCLPDLFGTFVAQLPMADGGDGSVSIIALHEGTDSAEVGQINSVQVTIGDVDWKADPEDVNIAGNSDVPEGQSEVTSVEVDGNTVRGTMTLAGSQTVFSADFVEFAEGTFEATCGEERTS